MKKLLLVMLLAPACLSANAFDVWKSNSFDGEIVFYSGFENELIVGKRGVGLGLFQAYLNKLFDEPITLKIDNEPPQQYKTKLIAEHTILIIDDGTLRDKVSTAKKIEAKYKRCTVKPTTCAFSITGESKPVVWEFETPLSEEFRDYKDKLK